MIKRALAEGKIKIGLEVRRATGGRGTGTQMFEVFKDNKRLGSVYKSSVTKEWTASKGFSISGATSHKSKEDAINSLDESAIQRATPALRSLLEDKKKKKDEWADYSTPPKGVVPTWNKAIVISGSRPPLEDNEGRAKLDAADRWAKENGAHIVWKFTIHGEASGVFTEGSGKGWREQQKSK